MVWNEEDQGMTYKVIDIPADIEDTVAEYRAKLIEAVAEYDVELMEKFFEDPDSITVPEINAAVRAAVMDLAFTPVMCGSAFKNKGVQAVLDAVCAFLPSPTDTAGITGTNPKTEKKKSEDR